jgi:Tol biopolymer transport system component
VPDRPNLRILTTGTSPREPALFAVDTATGHRERLLELPEQSMVTAFAEQPKGTYLLYALQKEGEFGQALWQLDLRTGERRQLLERTDDYLISGLAGQPEGTQAVLVLTPLLTSTTGARYPAGFAQDELWLIDTATSTHQQLTPPDTEGELVGWRWPQWSPEGQRLYVTRFSSAPPESARLLMGDVAGDTWTLLAHGLRALDPCGEDTLLVGALEEGLPNQVGLLNLQDPEDVALLSPPGWYDSAARCSPDGRYVVWAASPSLSESSRLLLLDRETQERRSITAGADNDYLPRWLVTESGYGVLFLRDAHELWWIDLQTLEEHFLTEPINVDYLVFPTLHGLTPGGD